VRVLRLLQRQLHECVGRGRGSERQEVLAFLRRHRLVKPDPQITEGFSALLEKYPYLRDQLADALIAATAWTKGVVDMRYD
jgi:hypothetical protein